MKTNINEAYPSNRHIEVTLEPEGKNMILPRPKTVLQLLNRLSLFPDSALIIRDNRLLTPDQRIYPGEHITVRLVISSG